MKLKVHSAVLDCNSILGRVDLVINSPFSKNQTIQWDWESLVAFPPFINSHDHLIGNWYPMSGTNRPYINSHIWVEDNKISPSVIERNRIWVNDASFDLLKGNAPLLAQLGVYKNLFSGVGCVQDHAPLQKTEYYQQFPISVLEKYRQCHSITLGNWWGGKEPEKEWLEAKGKMPFIIHIGEGFDDVTRNEFNVLTQKGLLQPNTLLVHAISLTKNELKACAEVGTSICWCAASNYYLIGDTLDIDTCLAAGVNVVIGTDSTLTGSINLFDEVRIAHSHFPYIPANIFFRMITENAQRALYLDKKQGILDKETDSVLIMKRKADNPYDNLFLFDMTDIELFVYKGKPVYGNLKYFECFTLPENDFFFFNNGNNEYFAYGHPERLIQTVDNILGYHKQLPYLPF